MGQANHSTGQEASAPARKKLVVLISGSGSNLQSIIDACQLPADHADAINADISAVISNRPGCYGLQRASDAGIPSIAIDHSLFDSRDAFDTELAATIDNFHPDLVILAGFMRILTDGFVARYPGRLVNIHPSLLPLYPGLHTHQRAIDAGDAYAGATVHFVTAELDGGPAIIQARVPVDNDDTADSLAAKVLQQEHRIYPTMVRWFCAERLHLQDGRVWLDGEILPKTGLPSWETCVVPGDPIN